MATLQNTTINSTGFLTIPVGNTTQRPGSPTNGMLRFNTDTGQIEVYNSGATAWGSITGPTISQIQITDSNYDVLDDTAVNTSGGYIKITGTGFSAGAVVVIGGVNATSTTVVNNTTLNVQVPAQVAGTYTVYVVNTNGGTAIGVNGLTYSALPNWVTGSSLPNGQTGTAISIQLNATDATSYALAPANTLPTGLTLTSGGLLSGTVTVGSETTYSFTIIATDAELQDSPRAFTITITVGDPYFYLTTLLLAGNGTNNGTNNAFTDSSTNALAITRYGNTTQGTYSPFSQTGWSNYFDGNGDYLTLASNAALTPGNQDYTFECWVFATSLVSDTMSIFGASSTGGFLFSIGANGTTILVNAYGTGPTNNVTGAIQSCSLLTNTWYHLAVSRQSGSTRFFINGILTGSATTDPNNYAQTAMAIGGAGAIQYFPGYISNLRFIKGTAVYTANFTPPTTPLTAIANTSLLTCQSNRFIDNSTNNFAITRNGDTSVQPFEPFAPGSSYSTGTVGGSAYLDGTGDYLTIADNTALDMGSSNFTIEGWYYPNGNTTNYPALFSKRANGSVVGGVLVYFAQTPTLLPSLLVDIGGAWAINTQSSIPFIAYQWNHFAVVRNDSAFNLYINGVSGVSATNAGSIPDNASAFAIGAMGADGSTPLNSCYISNFRIVKGTAVYTTTFTPPTAPVTAIANTSLLCNFTNGQILDSASKNLLETIADAKISTAQSKWGGSSIYLDGTGDYLVLPNSNSLDLGTGDFTIEAWVYPINLANNPMLYHRANAASGPGIGWFLQIGSNVIYFGAGTSSGYFATFSPTLTTNSWQHIAVTRIGSSLRAFVNGTATAAQTVTDANLNQDKAVSANIGNWIAAGFTLNAYIQDFRITRGYARYTGNFTPPTSAFPTQ